MTHCDYCGEAGENLIPQPKLDTSGAAPVISGVVRVHPRCLEPQHEEASARLRRIISAPPRG